MRALYFTLTLLTALVSFGSISHAEDAAKKSDASASPVVNSADSDEANANLQKAADENNADQEDQDPGAGEDAE